MEAIVLVRSDIFFLASTLRRVQLHPECFVVLQSKEELRDSL